MKRPLTSFDFGVEEGMRRLSGYVTAVTAVLCFVSSASAQGPANLRISVEDEVAGAINGVKLTLIHKTNGERREVTTDNAGRAAFEALPTGEYVLSAEAPGFQRLQRNVTVAANPSPLKLKMKIEVTEDVTVKGVLRAPDRRTASDQNADTIDIDKDLMANLPLPLDQVQLLSFIGDFLPPVAGGGDPTIIVDGMEVNNLDVPIAAIKHLLLKQNPYSPEYRRIGKARLEIITDDGSRAHFNANVGMTFTNTGLTARNALAETKPDSSKDLTELGFSGPLGADLGQFLVSGQHLNNNQNSVVDAVTLNGPFKTTIPTHLGSTIAFGRIDLKLSGADRMGFRYDYAEELERNFDAGGLILPELAVGSHKTKHQFRFLLNSKLSAASTNELKVLAQKDGLVAGAPPTGPQFTVVGAFEGGASQMNAGDQAKTVDILDTVSYTRRTHAVRFGGRVRVAHIDATEGSNFGGTYEFASLDLFAAKQADVFSISQGTPTFSFTSNEVDFFVQDEIKLRPDMTLMAGARYDATSQIHDLNNVAPRLTVAWAPGLRKTVYRAGTGIFYERLADRVRQKALASDGIRTRELIVTDPSYPDPFATNDARTVLPSIVRLDPNLTLPYMFMSSVAVERELRPLTLFTVEYSHVRGVRLYRSLNLNAPQPGTGLRADPNILNVDQMESSASMDNNALTFTLKSKVTNVLRTSLIYTYSHTNNDTGLPFSLPADNFNLAAEWGRADFDVRHKFSMASSLTLPREFQVGAVMVLASGPPYNITTGADDNEDGESTDRPLGVTRNTGQSPGSARLDLRLTKFFVLPRPAWSGNDKNQSRLEFNVDAFNVLNTTNLGLPVGVLSSPLFGRSNFANPARTVQASVKYRF